MTENSSSIVEIDENRLDKECIKLPSDYLKFAHLSIERKRKADLAKASLEVVEAEVSQFIRNDPAKYGLDKVTEAGIKTAVLLHKKYQAAKEEMDNARYEQDMAQAVVSALEHKKRSLTLLVELHGMGYFTSIKPSQGAKEAVKEMTNQRIRRRLNDDE